jgi:hypothetical protein
LLKKTSKDLDSIIKAHNWMGKKKCQKKTTRVKEPKPFSLMALGILNSWYPPGITVILKILITAMTFMPGKDLGWGHSKKLRALGLQPQGATYLGNAPVLGLFTLHIKT